MDLYIGGDSRYFWPENITNFTGLPQAWDASLNTGIGKSQINTLWITSYLNFSTSFSYLGLSWNIITILFWILPAVLIAFLSAYNLFKNITGLNKYFCFTAGIIYLINTYSIMIFLGGQVGIFMAYALLPLLLLRFIKLFYKTHLTNSIIAGFALSLQLLFDPRFFYLSLILLTIYWAFNTLWQNISLKKIFFWILLPALITLLLHSFWIVPFLLFKVPALPGGFDGISSFNFFSFADFVHAISLLHPNWPENIFGKVSFYNPLFMLFPLLAFSSLYFITKNKDNSVLKYKSDITILFFALILLIFAFLAKGVNEPFAFINIFLFHNMPGMSLFRDPTKFYAVIAISYSILTPFSLNRLLNCLPTNRNFTKIILHAILITVYITILSSQLITLNTNLLNSKSVPGEYVALKNMIVNENQFFRTLWIPYWQRYGYFSNLNPAIGRDEIFPFSYELNAVKKLNNEKTLQRLKELGVKYVILPYDSIGEIFINDRIYDERVYLSYKKELDSNEKLIKKTKFGKIVVYELKGAKDRFWLDSDLGLKWYSKTPTEYEIILENDKIENRIVFSDNFDPNWSAKFNGKEINSTVFNNNLNSFKIPKGIQKVEIYYKPQKWVNIGLAIGGISFLILTAIGIYKTKHKYEKNYLIR